jgi:hypothetical protein
MFVIDPIAGHTDEVDKPHIATLGLWCTGVSFRGWSYTPACQDEVHISYAGKQLQVVVDMPAVTYTLTVSNGTGSGDYEVGASVPITANSPPSGKVFKNWTSSNGGTFANANAANTKFTMPSNSVIVTANWEDIPATTYTLTVSGGIGSTGSGNYEAGKEVTISAGTSPAGKQFKNWTSSNGGTFANANAANTKFTMPSNSVTVTANWEDIPATTYTLTVSGGTGSTGSGQYEAGGSASISAGTPPSSKRFKNWTSSNGGSFADANSSSTTFTMPSNATTVTANWEDDIPDGVESVTKDELFVWGTQSALHINSSREDGQAYVYHFSGKLAKVVSYHVGETTVYMPAGWYIVRTEKLSFKVVVR